MGEEVAHQGGLHPQHVPGGHVLVEVEIEKELPSFKEVVVVDLQNKVLEVVEGDVVVEV